MSLGYVIVDSKHKDTDGSVRYGVVSENEYNEEIVYLDTLARTKDECIDLFCEGLSYTQATSDLNEVRIAKFKLVEVK